MSGELQAGRLARTLTAGASALQVQAKAVRATVESLTDCLLKSGMSCALAGSLVSPVSRGKPAHYISTLYQLGQDSQVTRWMMATH